MALRVGCEGPVLMAMLSGRYLTPSGGWWILARLRLLGRNVLRNIPHTENNQLRTGADKGNPTV